MALSKSLTTLRGAAVMLNIVVGAGLLALPGLVVKEAGNQALWAWGVAALAALPLLLVFLLMGQRFPDAGGIAHFARTAFGPRAYAIASLIFLGAVVFGLPGIALTGGHYIAEAIGGRPALYAILLVALAALSHLTSTEMAGRISSAIASIILFCLLGLVGLGFSVIDWSGAADTIASPAELSLQTLFHPFMMIFFAFTGWEVAAGLSEEFKNPRRDFPRAMALSFVAACLLYFAMAFTIQAVPITGSYEASFASLLALAFGEMGRLLMACLAALIILANLMGAIWGVSRLVFSLSREGLLPLRLKTNAQGTPFSAVLITSLVLFIGLTLDAFGLLNINAMLALAGQNFLLLYGITALALLRLSPRHADRLVALITLAVVAGLMVFQSASLLYPALLTLAGWVIGGLQHFQEKSTA
ncbi:APC family permease [Rhizobium paknamense]|uniref:Amino acid efflux transporter n=1 Tax=Rhizobium paknamense TaxID=1206817 RepID=A0ABU0I874_9HYPH|nr:amino acid permease [Rhizobium paknamense]MDQ0454439.1 amino acid efflux transporter [Rhizobium paknamense]